jgi:hypothetical protein
MDDVKRTEAPGTGRPPLSRTSMTRGASSTASIVSVADSTDKRWMVWRGNGGDGSEAVGESLQANNTTSGIVHHEDASVVRLVQSLQPLLDPFNGLFIVSSSSKES